MGVCARVVEYATRGDITTDAVMVWECYLVGSKP